METLLSKLMSWLFRRYFGVEIDDFFKIEIELFSNFLFEILKAFLKFFFDLSFWNYSSFYFQGSE